MTVDWALNTRLVATQIKAVLKLITNSPNMLIFSVQIYNTNIQILSFHHISFYGLNRENNW